MGKGLGLYCVFLAGALAAQESGPRVEIKPRAASASKLPDNTPRIYLDVKLVLVPVSVTDKMDRPIRGLQKEHFRIKDEGEEQEITTFSSEDAPVSVGVVFDASSSMQGAKMKDSRAAVDRFLDTAMPEDEFFLLKFNDRPEQLSSFTTDTEDIRGLLRGVYATGWTALLDALYTGVQGMRKAGNSRKALLVLSDGGDNNSRYSEPEIKDLVRESDVRIFAISIQDGSRLLKSLATESGGRAFRVRKLKQLEEVIAKVSADMRSQYVLGYTPKKLQANGKYHKVKVEITPPPGAPRLRVAWKRGYYAPAN
ncbi:MAG: VWA domain-containing protein [Rhodospirillales bacterium]